jgi:hypothetical protein
MAISRQRRGKHVPVVAGTDATVENMVFSLCSALTLYSEDQKDNQLCKISQCILR